MTIFLFMVFLIFQKATFRDTEEENINTNIKILNYEQLINNCTFDRILAKKTFDLQDEHNFKVFWKEKLDKIKNDAEVIIKDQYDDLKALLININNLLTVPINICLHKNAHHIIESNKNGTLSKYTDDDLELLAEKTYKFFRENIILIKKKYENVKEKLKNCKEPKIEHKNQDNGDETKINDDQIIGSLSSESSSQEFIAEESNFEKPSTIGSCNIKNGLEKVKVEEIQDINETKKEFDSIHILTEEISNRGKYKKDISMEICKNKEKIDELSFNVDNIFEESLIGEITNELSSRKTFEQFSTLESPIKDLDEKRLDFKNKYNEDTNENVSKINLLFDNLIKTTKYELNLNENIKYANYSSLESKELSEALILAHHLIHNMLQKNKRNILACVKCTKFFIENELKYEIFKNSKKQSVEATRCINDMYGNIVLCVNILFEKNEDILIEYLLN